MYVWYIKLLFAAEDGCSYYYIDDLVFSSIDYLLQVPHTTFLLTHVCFLFYHVTSNLTLRRLQHAVAGFPEPVQWVAKAAWILAFSYFIAYLETVAISNVSYREVPASQLHRYKLS